ncbi:MAG: hypothetical protein AVDCRST_MAG85-4163, partial [uncultured Solirubrobacteraceae bacterium]
AARGPVRVGPAPAARTGQWFAAPAGRAVAARRDPRGPAGGG